MPPQKPAPGLAIALRASSTSEAEIVRSLLDDAGLYAVIPDRNTPLPIDLTPLDGEYSLTGCDVVVHSGELARAKEIIEDARAAGDLDSHDSDFEDDLDEEDEDTDLDDDE